jgi:hypothetical protein
MKLHICLRFHPLFHQSEIVFVLPMHTSLLSADTSQPVLISKGCRGLRDEFILLLPTKSRPKSKLHYCPSPSRCFPSLSHSSHPHFSLSFTAPSAVIPPTLNPKLKQPMVSLRSLNAVAPFLSVSFTTGNILTEPPLSTRSIMQIPPLMNINVLDTCPHLRKPPLVIG